MLGLLALGLGIMCEASISDSYGCSNYNDEDNYTYRYNGLGEPYTFWDDEGNYGPGSAPFRNNCDDVNDEIGWW